MFSNMRTFFHVAQKGMFGRMSRTVSLSVIYAKKKKRLIMPNISFCVIWERRLQQHRTFTFEVNYS